MAVEEKVKAIIAEQLGVKPEEVTIEASFVDDLGADSLDTGRDLVLTPALCQAVDGPARHQETSASDHCRFRPVRRGAGGRLQQRGGL